MVQSKYLFCSKKVTLKKKIKSENIIALNDLILRRRVNNYRQVSRQNEQRALARYDNFSA